MFFTQNPKVTPKELKETLGSLRHGPHAFSESDMRDVKKIYFGSMEEEGTHAGIDRHEHERVLEHLREKKSEHGLSDDQITRLDEEITKRF